jgi:hypothetical protein
MSDSRSPEYRSPALMLIGYDANKSGQSLGLLNLGKILGYDQEMGC